MAEYWKTKVYGEVYEPVSRTYRVMRYEDEMMEVVR
jgi:hypothetical protein